MMYPLSPIKVVVRARLRPLRMPLKGAVHPFLNRFINGQYLVICLVIKTVKILILFSLIVRVVIVHHLHC